VAAKLVARPFRLALGQGVEHLLLGQQAFAVARPVLVLVAEGIQAPLEIASLDSVMVVSYRSPA
jgi:hypothetical protein